jgi:two-component system sensor histidine kinase ChiS
VSETAKDGAHAKKILVADDDPALLQMIERILTEVGQVKCANDGLEALNIIQAGFVPDIVITDVMMPRIDGLKLCQQIKKMPQTADVPVIMLTAKGHPKDIVSGINAGVRYYVTKPFKTAELVAKVKKTLRIA